MTSSNDYLSIKFTNHVLIRDAETNEVLVDTKNDVHPQNLARVIARGLAGEPNNNIFRIGLGNGGTYNESITDTTRFNPPNTTGTQAKLYNETYFELVSAGNSTTSAASTTDITSTVQIEIILDPSEPGVDQWLTDASGAGSATNPVNPQLPGSTAYVYEFDELALFAQNPLWSSGSTTENEFLLLTHVIFHPIAKTQNRKQILNYSLTISVS